MEGWKENIGKARQIEELPRNTRLYIDRLQELAGVKLALVSVGAGRDETIILRNPFGD
jgi:adenylosuccinate synthase